MKRTDDELHTYTIPVAFHVMAKDELSAALVLVEGLRYLGVINSGDEPYKVTPDEAQAKVMGPDTVEGWVDQWWTPNQPLADRSDNAGHLVFIKPIIEDGTYESVSPKVRQALAEEAVDNYYARLDFESGPANGGAF